MTTKLKPVEELIDLEANQELTELLGGCWHVPRYNKEVHEKGLDGFIVDCEVCGNQLTSMTIEDLFYDDEPMQPYATSYNDIIPVIQGLIKADCDNDNVRWDFDYRFFDFTPRELLNAVIQVLRPS